MYPDILENPGDYLRVFFLILFYAWKLAMGRIQALGIRGIARKWVT